MENDDLKLPWRGVPPKVSSPTNIHATVVTGSDDKPVCTVEQKRFAIAAANNYHDLLRRLHTVEEAYVRMCRNAGATEPADVMLRRLFGEGEEVEPVCMTLVHDDAGSLVLAPDQTQAIYGILTVDPAGCTPDGDKVAPDPLNGANDGLGEVSWATERSNRETLAVNQPCPDTCPDDSREEHP
jgi:hypothetical protein